MNKIAWKWLWLATAIVVAVLELLSAAVHDFSILITGLIVWALLVVCVLIAIFLESKKP